MSLAKLLSCLIAVFLTCAPALAAPEGFAAVQAPPASGTATQASASGCFTGRDLLRQALDLLIADDFAQAEHVFASSLELTSDDSRNLQTWLNDYQEFLAQRGLRRQASSQRHIAKAQEELRDGDLQQALASAYRAAKVSPDPKTLRNEPWLKELVQLCAAEAEKLVDQGKYAEATVILREIALIFPEDQSWKQRFEQAALRAGILGAYDKQSNWQRRLRDADPHDFERAVEIVDKYYVKTVDYRKMLLSVIKGFRSFLTTKGLDDAFEDLGNRLAVIRLLDSLGKEADQAQKAPDVTAANLIETYWRIVHWNRQSLQVPDPVLVDLLAAQAFQTLDDYSEMIWPDQQDWFARSTIGSFSGIGVQIRLNEAKQLEVVTPLDGTPAFKAGLQADDLIVAVDGRTTKGIAIDEAIRRITGEKGTKVVLTMRRSGRAEEFDVAITRDTIKIESVRGYNRLPDNGWNYIVDQTQKIAYVRITNFTKNTVEELDQAIRHCRSQDARALILDLRFNPGGTLKAAEEVTDRFLPPGEVIVRTDGRGVKPTEARTSKSDFCAGWPVVILTSDRSASAAEIVAGALQDHSRAIVVGQRTFGKGLVQRPFRLPGWAWSNSDVSMKLTTAYWYLPKGRNVQRSDDDDHWGVQPDFAVDLTPDEFTSLNTRWSNAIIIHPPDVKPHDWAPESDSNVAPADLQPDANVESPATESAQPDAAVTDDDSSADEPLDLPDPQLQTALLVTRLELLVGDD